MWDFTKIMEAVNGLVWNNALVALCLITGLYFTFRLRFPQIRFFKEMVRLLLHQESSGESGITPFQAFATTIGSRVGMGSVAGVATGIYFGGPGAVFWMWVLGLLGAGTALAESALAQAYKDKVNGEYVGGPALFIEKGIKCKPYAVVFALATILGPGILMPGLHANSLASTFQRAFGTNMITGGVILAVLLAVVTFGGVKRIGRFAEKAAPVMCLVYMGLAIGILFIFGKNIPSVLADIITSAFGQNAVFGGIAGSAIIWGVKRGVYSTEAGQGSGAIVSAAAECTHPAKQGLIQALSVYIVSFIVCTSTAIILLLSKSYNVIGPDGASFLVEYLPGSPYGIGWTQDILESVYGTLIGGKVFAVIISLFIFTSLIGYSYQAESNTSYLFKGNKTAITIMRIIFIISTFSGVLINGGVVWTMGDTGAGLMAWLNIIAVLILSKQVVAILKDFEKQKAEGRDPVFDPEQFGISDDTGVWRNLKK
ncbi:sodium:alanine symporter family protein [uncultured Clostridium sp.]|uniref:alanine/glycine:cation symporter family protein n=1 Tax=uncultured Clostridium sp. TaxID=59620 RepID=UPI0025E702A5|nr:alanine/glycine:cation symporter family protein [uncultured Clostridium sp.]